MIRPQELGMYAVDNIEESAKPKTYWVQVTDMARSIPDQWFKIDRDDLSRTTILTMVGRINSGRYGKDIKAISRKGVLYIQADSAKTQ